MPILFILILFMLIPICFFPSFAFLLLVVGETFGIDEGDADTDGSVLGAADGTAEGDADIDGSPLGVADGIAEGPIDEETEGTRVGDSETIGLMVRITVTPVFDFVFCPFCFCIFPSYFRLFL
jgi:hypothetical protein